MEMHKLEHTTVNSKSCMDWFSRSTYLEGQKRRSLACNNCFSLITGLNWIVIISLARIKGLPKLSPGVKKKKVKLFIYFNLMIKPLNSGS